MPVLHRVVRWQARGLLQDGGRFAWLAWTITPCKMLRGKAGISSETAAALIRSRTVNSILGTNQAGYAQNERRLRIAGAGLRIPSLGDWANRAQQQSLT